MLIRAPVCYLLTWNSLFLLIKNVLGAYEPTNLQCVAVNSTVLTFTWTLPAGGSGVVQGYHLDLVRTDGIKVDVLPQLTINGYYVDTYTFYGIGKYGQYTLTMHSFTSGGNQADVTHTCRTLQDVPDRAPSGVNSTGTSISTIYVEWTELENYYRNGILEGYKIIYFKYGSDNPSEVTVSNATLSHTLSGLSFDTWYVVSVLAYTSAGDGPRSTDPDKTWGLITEAPPGITRYYCYQAIPDTFEIDWDEMPCTVYVGIIGALFTFMMIFLCACLSQCCGSKQSKKEEEQPQQQRGIYRGFESSVIKVKMMKFRKRAREKKNSVSPQDEDEGFCDDEDGFPRNKGDLTARDVHISSPLPEEYEKPPAVPAPVPVISKMHRDPSSFDLEMGNMGEDTEYGEFKDGITNENETGELEKPESNDKGGSGPKGDKKPPVHLFGVGQGEPEAEIDDGGDDAGGIEPNVSSGKGPDFTMLQSGDGFF